MVRGLFSGGKFSSGKIIIGGNCPVGHCLGTIFLGAIVRRRGQLSGEQSPSGQLSGGQLSREKFTSVAIVLEPLQNTYFEEHLLAAASDFF